MRIVDSSISLSSSHQLQRSSVEAQSVSRWYEREQSRGAPPSSGGIGPDTVSLSREAVAMLPVETEIDPDTPLSDADELEMKIMTLILEAVTGQRFDIMTPGEVARSFEGGDTTGDPGRRVGPPSERPTGDPPGRRVGPVDPNPVRGNAIVTERWGMQVDMYRSFREQEKTSFEAQGVIKTADGREISIDVELRMAREWAEEHVVSTRVEGERTTGGVPAPEPEMVDPLVINFSGDPAELTSTRFAFDLDVDGQTDQIAMLAPSSAYLAVDSNGDGVINDGSELFGPTTGDGFAELAQHDEDNNGWIDEGDSIFDRLRLWSQSADGSSRLVGLGSAGVGAIYLGHVSTEFALNDADNQALGQVTDTSIYLNEDGGVGTIQEIDLAV